MSLFPCDIISNNQLEVKFTIKKKKQQAKTTSIPISIPTTITSTTSIQSKNKTNTCLLDTTSGIAILKHIYDGLSLFDNEQTPISLSSNTRGYLPNHVNDTSYISDSFVALPLSSNDTRKRNKQEDMNLIEKGKILFNLRPVEENIKYINKNLLMKYNVTINVLIKVCEVPITNLKIAGIINNFDDLCDLGFQLSDLTWNGNRELFNVGHIQQIFNMNYTSIKSSRLGFDLEDLIHSKFAPAELITLEFSLADMIEEGGISARHFLLLEYRPNELSKLGLSKQHLKKLNININYAVSTLKWSPKEFNEI